MPMPQNLQWNHEAQPTLSTSIHHLYANYFCLRRRRRQRRSRVRRDHRNHNRRHNIVTMPSLSPGPGLVEPAADAAAAAAAAIKLLQNINLHINCSDCAAYAAVSASARAILEPVPFKSMRTVSNF